MADHIYSISEIVGSSTESIDDAIRGAVGRASKTLHNLEWFEVTDTRAVIDLCSCTGEPMERVESDAPEVIEFVRARGPLT